MKKTKINLHGGIGERFGKSFEFLVSNARDAIQALKVNLKGFDVFLRKSQQGGCHFHVFVDGRLIEDSASFGAFCEASEIDIVPVFIGSGLLESIGLILLGSAAIFFSGGALAGTVFGSFLGNLGVGLIVAGIASLLYTPPEQLGAVANTNAGANSYFFGGRSNTARQGVVIPIAYGRLKIGSAIISSSVINEDLKITEND